MASVYAASGRISRSSRVGLWEMTSGLSPYSALSLVRQRRHVLCSSFSLGDDFKFVSVFSAQLGSTVDTCWLQSMRLLEEFHTFST